MADRFDELMKSVARRDAEQVDFDALRQSILAENAKRGKKRAQLRRMLSAAAVFALLVTAGVAVLSPRGAGSDASANEAATQQAAGGLFDMFSADTAAPSAPFAGGVSGGTGGAAADAAVGGADTADAAEGDADENELDDSGLQSSATATVEESGTSAPPDGGTSGSPGATGEPKRAELTALAEELLAAPGELEELGEAAPAEAMARYAPAEAHLLGYGESALGVGFAHVVTAGDGSVSAVWRISEEETVLLFFGKEK